MELMWAASKGVSVSPQIMFPQLPTSLPSAHEPQISVKREIKTRNEDGNAAIALGEQLARPQKVQLSTRNTHLVQNPRTLMGYLLSLWCRRANTFGQHLSQYDT